MPAPSSILSPGWLRPRAEPDSGFFVVRRSLFRFRSRLPFAILCTRERGSFPHRHRTQATTVITCPGTVPQAPIE